MRRVACAFALLLLGCSRPSNETVVRVGDTTPAVQPTKAAPPSASPREPLSPTAALEGARGVYAGRCSTCHGREGLGDGPAAAAFTPRPRNFHDSVWQGTTSDEAIRSIVLKGGPAAGKSSGMPANLDLAAEPEVVEQLVAVVRGFGPDAK